MKQLTEKQQAFLNVLFDEAQGNVAKAKSLAGYAEGSSTTSLVNALKAEIQEAT